MCYKNTVVISEDLKAKLSDSLRLKYTINVYGDVGRSVLIRSVCPDVLFYDAREVSDSKMTSGYYALENGEVTYHEGMLVDAMRGGKKVCFKHIDINKRLEQHLMPVIRDRRIVTSRGDAVIAHENFRLLLTSEVKLEVRGVECIGPIRYTLSDVTEMFGEYKGALLSILRFISENKRERCSEDRATHCDGVCLRSASSCCLDEIWKGNKSMDACGTHFRAFCHMLRMMHSQEDSCKRRLLYQSLINNLLRHESSKLRETMLVVQDTVVLAETTLSKTEALEEALRGVAANIRAKRPTLLVGETGAGKTALISYLANSSSGLTGSERVVLDVVNMSADMDITELLGGYKTLDIDCEIEKAYRKEGLSMPLTTNRCERLDYLLQNNPQNTQALLCKKMISGGAPFVFREGVLIRAMREGRWVLLDELNLAPRDVVSALDALLSRSHPGGTYDCDYSSTTLLIHSNFRVFACMNPAGDYGKKAYIGNVFGVIWMRDFSTQLRCVQNVVHGVLRGRFAEAESIARFYYAFREKIACGELSNELPPLVSGRTLSRALKLMLQLQAQGKDSPIWRAIELLFFTQLDVTSRGKAQALFAQHIGVSALPQRVSEAKRASACIPRHFVITPSVEIYLRDIELAIDSKLPVLLQGATSCGKTSMVYALAERYGRRVVRLNNHAQTEAADYVGQYATYRGAIQFRPGPLVRAMEAGDWLILDELNLAPSDVLEVLNRLLDDNRELYVPDMDRIVRPHPNFQLFATQNIAYGGRHGLAKSLRNRFVEITVGEKQREELGQILTESYGMPSGFAEIMLDVYETLRMERTLNALMTARDLFRWAQRGPSGYSDLYYIGTLLLVPRQRTREDRKRVESVIEEVFVKRKKKIEKRMPGKDCEEAGGIVWTESYRRTLELVIAAWEANEPVLLVGETGLGKTRLISEAARLTGRMLVTANMHSGTECAEFVGTQTLNEGEVEWRDGALVEAMQKGDAFLIDEINLAEDAVLERLNSLLEEGRSLFVAETESRIVADERFQIAATMNPGGDYGKRELSPALRSRFTEVYFDVDESERREIFGSLIEKVIDRAYYMMVLPGNISVRKIELVSECIRLFSGLKDIPEDCILKVLDKKEDIWKEAQELMKGESVAREGGVWVDKGGIGVSAYGIRKALGVSEKAFGFTDTPVAAANMRSILRGLCLGRPVLLTGGPGIGKTSVCVALGRAAGRRVVRVNLSEETELGDLLGTYVPQGKTLRFVESEMIKTLRDGGWVILDEVNLCSQSVIEGLNSLLDYRKSVVVNGRVIEMGKGARIFGTMNASDGKNGRKPLPKSFIDRFVVVNMLEYDPEDIKKILETRYGKDYLYSGTETLRGNMNLNELFKANKKCMGDSIRELRYRINNKSISISDTHDLFKPLKTEYKRIDLTYVIPHSQLSAIDTLLRSILAKVPVVLQGEVGRSRMLRFLSDLLDLELVTLDCSPETDTYDLLGQYQKTETGSSAFEWVDSHLIKALSRRSLIAIYSPDTVEKAVFDRLNGLFESERELNLFERGLKSKVEVHPEVSIVLCLSTSPDGLSEALRDRCVFVDLPSSYDTLDAWKVFCACKGFFSSSNVSSPTFLLSTSQMLLDLAASPTPSPARLDRACREYSAGCLDLPSCFSVSLPIGNILIEEDIDRVFAPPTANVSYVDASILDAYNRSRSFATPLPSSWSERTALLHAWNSGSSCAWLPLCKLIEMPLSSNSNLSGHCLDIPTDLYQLKTLFLSKTPHRYLGEIYDLHAFSVELLNTKTVRTDFPEFPRILLGEEDPLHVLIRATENEISRKLSEELHKVSHLAKELYKYGRDNGLESALQNYRVLSEELYGSLAQLHLRASRDYPRFREVASEITLCRYYHDRDLREFFQEFSDISDLLLSNLLFAQPNPCSACAMSVTGASGEYASFLHTDLFSPLCLGYEYSKRVFGVCTKNKKILQECVGSFILESFFETCDAPSNKTVTFTEAEIDTALRSLFPKKTQVRALESKRKRISLAHTSQIPDSLRYAPIFSTPEEIVAALRSEADAVPLYAHLIALYKEPCVLERERNYRLFRLLLDSPDPSPSDVLYERFFVGSTVSEHLDALYFAEKCLGFCSTPLSLYGITLRYKAFEIDVLHTKKLEETRAKLIKEPALFESTLRAFVDRFLLLPVVSLLDIRFESPGCQGGNEHLWEGPSQLIGNEGGDECAQWINLGRSIDRRVIREKLSGAKADYHRVFSAFYTRIPEGVPFGYAEICLGKVFVSGLNAYRSLPSEEHPVLLALLDAALQYVFPPFLYFVFRYTQITQQEESESGPVFGAGCGADQAEMQTQEVCDEYDGDGNDNGNESGVDDNREEHDGELFSVSGEEAAELGVDDKPQENSAPNEDENEFREGENEGSRINELEDTEGSEGECVIADESDQQVDKDSVDAAGDEENEYEASAPADDKETGKDTGEGCSKAENEDGAGLTEYGWREEHANNIQTCDTADGYSRKVEGTGRDLDALREGDGNEQIEGDGLSGKGLLHTKRVVWEEHDEDTSRLVELLRVALESNTNRRYRGDYKSGKKLNMKRLVTYIASEYRRDKIWMRRQRSDKPDYSLRIFIDNSKSMYDQELINILSKIYSKLAKAFSILGIPVQLYKFSSSAVPCTVSDLTFDEDFTGISWINDYQDGINIILTDGIFQSTVPARDNFLAVLIDRGQLRQMSRVSMLDNRIFIERYLDTFGLRFCIIDDFSLLEHVFVSALSEIIKDFQ